MTNVRTRFSPSPTGKLHIGGLRTALYNFLYARQQQGEFLLRIEDTDRTRLVPGAVDNIIQNLRWAGLTFDQEPVTQSERLPLYRRYAEQLLASGHAYRCTCTAERLESLRRDQEAKKLPMRYDGRCRALTGTPPAAAVPSVIRFAMPQLGTIACDDLIRGRILFNAATLDDQILVKTDGFPTYHLASVVDDHEMKITHVIRGEEWLPSMPKHILLYQALGWTPPTFAHLPLLLNPDRSKLSKRTGDVAVDEYREAGYLPEALLNFVALLGWNPGTEQEVFSLQDLIEKFSFERVNKSGAVFNRDKLDWINGWYLRHLPTDQLVALAHPVLQAAGLLKPSTPQDFVQRVVALEQSRLKRLGELPPLVQYFFDEPALDPAMLPWRSQTAADCKTTLLAIASLLEGLPNDRFTANELQIEVKKMMEERKWGNGETLWPLRVALSGRRASPGPFEILPVLGKTTAVARLKRAAQSLS
ncbi:MAG: glutamate--tRNA ligase [bacterium]|nr:glutamate--tRNA ligase [bacterium]